MAIFMASFALIIAACAPNPREEFDATCGNDLECMGWYVTDHCDDELDTTYLFFKTGETKASWGPFTTDKLGEYETGTLKCSQGQQICIGAAAGDYAWGLGLDGKRSCEHCCGQCNGMSYTFDLFCGKDNLINPA